SRPCPYILALDIAEEDPIVIHNLHSFFYQVWFSERFMETRNLMVIDECHDLPQIVRSFIETSLTISENRVVFYESDNEYYTNIVMHNAPAKFTCVEEWVDFILSFYKTSLREVEQIKDTEGALEDPEEMGISLKSY